MDQFSRFLISATALIGLNGCSAVSYMDNERMISSHSFVANSTQIDIDLPSATVFDRHYEIHAGDYQVTNVDTGYSSGETTRMESSIELNLVDSVVMEQDWLIESELYSVDLARNFSFDLLNTNSGSSISSNCDLRHRYLKEEKSRVFKDEEPQSETTRPLSSLLACAVGGESNQPWQLFMTTENGVRPKFVLQTDDLNLRLEPEYTLEGERVNLSGEVLDVRRDRHRDIVGLRIYDDRQQIATLFLYDDYKIRLSHIVDERQKQQLFAVLYNFIILDRVHRIWTEQGL